MAAPKQIPLTLYQQCANNGMTQAETARELGVSEKSVSYIAHTYDIQFGGYTKEAIIQAAKDGLSIKDTALKFGVSYNAIYGYKTRYNIAFKRARSGRVPAVKKRKVKWPKYLSGLSSEVWAWVVATIPENTTVSEYIVSIVNDAYYDDTPLKGDLTGEKHAE